MTLLTMTSAKRPDTWPKQSQSCATLATTNTPPSFKATSMDLNAHIGYPTAPRSRRFCLRCPEGFIKDHTWVNDGEAIFTDNPSEALAFLDHASANARVALIADQFPGLFALVINFEKHGTDWVPTNQ